MPTTPEPVTTCLDVAVDHRIRLLFKPTEVPNAETSEHVSSLEERGKELSRSKDEREVTAQLAGPAFKGGIAVILQQPRRKHPFEDGLEAVIEDCETLKALDEVFEAASCGKLNIRTQVGVIDLMPYISDDVRDLNDEQVKEAFRASVKAVCEKEPDVVLLAGRVWLPNRIRFDNRKGDAWKLECLGPGKVFGREKKFPTKTRVSTGSSRLVTAERVNGFHPSYAMNRHPHQSILRQLLMLVAAETCAVLRTDWEEEAWMDYLRDQCRERSIDLSGTPMSPSRSRPLPTPPQSPRSPGTTRATSSTVNSPSGRGIDASTTTIQPTVTRYFTDYAELYGDALLALQSRALKLLSDPTLRRKSSSDIYEIILNARTSEFANDVSLLLRTMGRLKRRGWPETIAWKNERAMHAAGDETLDLVTVLSTAVKTGRTGTGYEDMISCAVTKIKACVRTTIPPRRTSDARLGSLKDESAGRVKHEIDLDKARDVFLQLAVDAETLLMGLLEDKIRALEILGQEETLSSMLGGMTLSKEKESL